MWLEIFCASLIIANIVTLWWALTKRVRVSHQVKALQSAVRAFSAEGYSLIEIRRINPDNVFMRNPEGH
jgi:hypothetical protein